MKVHFKTNRCDYFIKANSILIRLNSDNRFHVAVFDKTHNYELYLDESNKNKLVGCLGSGNVMPIEGSIHRIIKLY